MSRASARSASAGPRVLLVGHADVIRDGLSLVLQRAGCAVDAVDWPGPDAIARAADADVAVVEGWGFRPRLAVEPFEVVGALRAARPRLGIVLLLPAGDAALAAEALARGANAVLAALAATVQLDEAVRAAAAGRTWVDPRFDHAAQRADGDADDGAVLTPRELDVLRLVALGYTNGEVARYLHLSVRSVEAVRSSLGGKIGARRRADLVRLARRLGLFGASAALP